MRCMSLQLPDRDVFCKHNYARQTHSFYQSQRPYWWNALLAVANTWRVSWFFLAPPVIIHFRLGFSIFFNINQACWSILGYTVLETAMESCELLVNCWGWSIIPKGKVSSRYVDPWHSRSMSHCQQVRIFFRISEGKFTISTGQCSIANCNKLPGRVSKKGVGAHVQLQSAGQCKWHQGVGDFTC